MAQSDERSTLEVGFAAAQGELLRAARTRLNLTLQDVEVATQGEFKPAGLSAYERGERSVPTIRLLKLASLYDAELKDLIPPVSTEFPATHQDADTESSTGQRARPHRSGVRIDLLRLQELDVPGAEQLRSFAENVQAYRGGRNSRHLWLREDDLLAVAVMFGTAADGVVEVMAKHGIVDPL